MSVDVDQGFGVHDQRRQPFGGAGPPSTLPLVAVAQRALASRRPLVDMLSGDAFTKNTSGTVTEAEDRIIYETDTGELYYDFNGNRSGGTYVEFAMIAKNLALTNADFLVV